MNDLIEMNETELIDCNGGGLGINAGNMRQVYNDIADACKAWKKGFDRGFRESKSKSQKIDSRPTGSIAC
ncbi:MAG: hypothetical protein JXR86_14925 [Spirochaetales bacterium]|nr:hypothetical protein [Spirochaetales bacterium]